MNSQASAPTASFSAGWSGFKPAIGLAGGLLLCLLIVLRVIPFFRFPTLLLFIASACFMLVRRHGTPDVLHPVRVFGALWCFCLALASMRLLSYISDWNLLTWTCLLTGLTCFVIGFWLADRNSEHQRTALKVGCSEDLAPRRFLPARKTLIVAWLCFAVGIAVLAYEFYLLGEIPLLSDNPDISRFRLFGTAESQFDKLYLKLLHPLVDFIKYGVLLAVIVLCQRKAKDRKTVFLSSLLILSGTLALLSQGGRVFLVYIVVPSAVLFHYLRRRIRLVEVVSATLIMFLVLGLFGYLRSSGKSQSAPLFESVRRISSFPEGQFWDGVAFGYGTLTLSYEVFFRLTQDLENMQHPAGGFLFYSLHRFIPRSELGEIARDLYTGELTTATYLGDLYGDYQYWGVLLGSLLMGFGYGWAYSREHSGNRMYWIYVRALLVQMLIFFPYVNFFSIYVNWIFDLFFMYLLIRHLSAHGDGSLRPVAGSNAAA